MEIAISVPEELFDRVEKQVARLGMTHSDFFTSAAKRYMDELDAEVTEQINAAIDAGAVDEDLERDITVYGRRFILQVTADDEW
jgi:metal-responsive CopG/Arc/MetJ family transcriptional regulator